MKLAALGLVTIVIGVALTEPGLLAIGALWVLIGPVMRQHGRRLTELQGDAKTPKVDGRTFAIGTLLWLLLGVPSLLVGLLELGISQEHADWRWLPLVVGGLALGIGVLSAGLYLLGSAVSAVADQLPQPTVPATIRIRKVTETGTYINERPRLEFELTVEPEPSSGLASYEVTKKATVPFTAMGSLKVGDGFKALVVGPEEPTSMEIGWDQPVTDGSDDVPARLAALDQLKSDGKVTDEEYRAQRDRILGSL